MSARLRLVAEIDAHVHRPPLARSEHFEGAVLQHAQQLDLRRRRRGRQSRRGRSCRRAPARSGPCDRARVGEGAAHVAEQLAFEQRRRDAAEIDLDERTGAAPAVAVDGVGDQLLARAALAGNQHRRIGRADPAGDLQDLQQAGSSPTRSPKSKAASRSSRSSGDVAAPAARPTAPARCGRSAGSARWSTAW